MQNSFMRKKEYIIHIDLEEKQDLYDEFNWQILNDKLANYIDKQISKSRFSDKLIIEIKAGFMRNNEKEKMRNCIIAHYQDVLTEMYVYNKASWFKKVLLLLIGIFFLIVANNLKDDVTTVFVELINIAGWVAVWEVVYNMLFTDNEHKFKSKRASQLIKADIKFV